MATASERSSGGGAGASAPSSRRLSAQAVEVRLPAAVVTENMEARCRLFPWRFEDTDLLGQRRIVIGMASLASC